MNYLNGSNVIVQSIYTYETKENKARYGKFPSTKIIIIIIIKEKKCHSYKLAHMLPFHLQLAQSFHAYAFLAKGHFVQFTS